MGKGIEADVKGLGGLIERARDAQYSSIERDFSSMPKSMSMSSQTEPIFEPSAPSPGDGVKAQSPWEKAWDTLSDKDKKQYGDPSSSMLEVLNGVCEPYSASSNI